MAPGPCAGPAEPLWRLAPTRGEDGRSLADFMMLIPGLARKPKVCRERVASLIREVCESYGDRVVFADINYAINVVWVSVAADPGLGGQVARSIRQRVPDALLVGGHLGVTSALQAAAPLRHGWWQRLRRLSRRAARLANS
ncbi:MAG: hypothetical protein KJN79_03905 [Gammaproteobacteria bacterium]|nr:hypothetical protein [Gammaproteobacteria bacterium]